MCSRPPPLFELACWLIDHPKLGFHCSRERYVLVKMKPEKNCSPPGPSLEEASRQLWENAFEGNCNRMRDILTSKDISSKIVNQRLALVDSAEELASLDNNPVCTTVFYSAPLRNVVYSPNLHCHMINRRKKVGPQSLLPSFPRTIRGLTQERERGKGGGEGGVSREVKRERGPEKEREKERERERERERELETDLFIVLVHWLE